MIFVDKEIKKLYSKVLSFNYKLQSSCNFNVVEITCWSDKVRGWDTIVLMPEEMK